MGKPKKPNRGGLGNIPATGDLTAKQLTAIVRELQKRVEQLTLEVDARYDRDDEIAAAAKVLREK